MIKVETISLIDHHYCPSFKVTQYEIKINIIIKFIPRSATVIGTLALLLLSTLYIAPASAYGHGGGHYYGHGNTHIGIGIGIGLNLFPGYYRPYYYPSVYYDYPYYSNEVIVRAVPAPTTVYIEQPSSNDPNAPNYATSAVPPSVSPSAGGSIWYYCHNPDGFYPSIKSCPGGWQKVPVLPPPSDQ
jgi:hypothetical protein